MNKLDELTREELQQLRTRARVALMTGEYERFGNYANVEKVMLSIDETLEQKKYAFDEAFSGAR